MHPWKELPAAHDDEGVNRGVDHPDLCLIGTMRLREEGP